MTSAQCISIDELGFGDVRANWHNSIGILGVYRTNGDPLFSFRASQHSRIIRYPNAVTRRFFFISFFVIHMLIHANSFSCRLLYTLRRLLLQYTILYTHLKLVYIFNNAYTFHHSSVITEKNLTFHKKKNKNKNKAHNYFIRIVHSSRE